MKPYFLSLLLILVLFSCKDSDQLTFEPISFDEGSCTSCPEITINIPKALENSQLDKNINISLKEEIIALLTFDDEITASSIEEAITSFKNGQKEIRTIYPEEATAWEAKIEGRVVYEDIHMLTIELKSYLFTGGAHGYGTTRFLNFDKKKAVELENWELFSDPLDFEHFAEMKFRIQERIPQDKPINSTGFMFEKEEFYLPENIGFTKKGIELRYNEYEVASYTDGPIILTLPYKEIEKYLSTQIKS